MIRICKVSDTEYLKQIGKKHLAKPLGLKTKKKILKNT